MPKEIANEIVGDIDAAGQRLTYLLYKFEWPFARESRVEGASGGVARAPHYGTSGPPSGSPTIGETQGPDPEAIK